MKKILISITLITLMANLLAQSHNEQVTVIAPYQPSVLDAYKINIAPQTIDSTLTPREARYDILSRKVITSFGIDNIRPARVAGEPLSKLSPLYARAGYGNYNTSYAEVFYGSERSTRWQYGAHLKHRASSGTFENYHVPFDNSVNLINLYGDYFGKKFLLSTDFYYDRKRYSTYGVEALYLSYDTLFGGGKFLSDKQYKRVYSNVGGSIQFSDNNSEPNRFGYFGYSGKLEMNRFESPLFESGLPGITESMLAFSGNAHQAIDFSNPLFYQTILGIDYSVAWYNNNNEVLYEETSEKYDTPNSKMIQFRPYGKMSVLGHDFALGLRVSLMDKEEDGNDVQVAPTVNARFSLIDNLLSMEFGLDGNAEYITHRKLAAENPFGRASSLAQSEHYKTQKHWASYLRMNTALSKTVDFSMTAKMVWYENLLTFDAMPYYFYEPSYSSYLTPTLSRSTPFFFPNYQDINCYQFQADLSYHLDEKIAVLMMGRANFYDDDILYKPKYEASAMARYNMQDKIILKTELYLSGGRKYTDYSQYDAELSKFKTYVFLPTIDWNLSAEYRFNKRWAAFLELNNILGQRSYEWLNYGSYRTNFLLGITFNL